MHNVLIVDEEEHLLATLEQNLFPDRDDITILTATSGESALEHLKKARIDLLVSDIKMPGRIDGFQLILRAKEAAPDARVVIITAFGSNRVQNFADRIGITHYIEKPFDTKELRDVVLEILDEKQGFQGVLSDLELTDIIQMLCMARRTALLHLKHRDRRGRIVFDGGEVVHAEFDDLVGADAVYRMLALRQGDIFMQSDFRNEKRTITVGWQDLLFEGVRRADEERADLDDEEEDAYAEQESNTDVGRPLAPGELPPLEASPSTGVDESFFSEEELREIELATGEDSEPALPFAKLAEDSDFDETDFRSPFRREPSGVMDDAAISPTAAEADPATRVVEYDEADLSFVDLQSALERFARECPGLASTAIVSTADGTALTAVNVSGRVDIDAFAALLADIVRAASRAIEALGRDNLEEIQVATHDQFVIVRAVEDTAYHHVAVVDKAASLGVALVLMRRVQRALAEGLEDL